MPHRRATTNGRAMATTARRKKVEAFLETVSGDVSKAIRAGKSTDLPLRGGRSRARGVRCPAAVRLDFSRRRRRWRHPPIVAPHPPRSPVPVPIFSPALMTHTAHHVSTLINHAEHFFCNNFPTFASKVKDLRARCGALLDAFGVDGAKDGATDPELATRCDYDDDLCQSVVAVVDDHLDAVDHQLAEAHVAGAGGYTGPAARGSAASALGRDANKGTKNAGARNSFVSRRPQDSFDVPVDNSNVPFMPPVPVNHPDPSSYVPSAGTHPLREELDDLIYPSSVTVPPSSPVAPATTSSTVCEFIDTPEALEDMAHHLSSMDEIAVDLEHHSFRSFQGFTCTIQVSTRTRDFVVDALALRTEIRAALGPCMADCGKLKVFHGADMDVQWLQRDFGIYIVGMFDTGQAARVLELPRKGLAYLLDHYCGIKADKRFQLADWRIRPLSDAMIEYARGDTHHLLYVYDRLRQQLDAVGLGDGSRPRVDLIKTTLDRSRDVCATLYDKPVTDQLTYHVDYRKNRDAGDLDLPRLAVYAALHSWRDKTSRTEDESIGYVMPRALLLRLAREAPTTPRSLLAVTRGDSPLVAKHSGEIVDLIARAMAAGTPPALPPTAGEEYAKSLEEKKLEEEEEKKGGDEPMEIEIKDAKGVTAPVPVVASEVAGSGGTSAMAAMMGGSSARAPADPAPAVAPAAVASRAAVHSSMARLLSASSATTSSFSTTTTTIKVGEDDAKAAKAAASVAAALASSPVPLAQLFPHWHGAKDSVVEEAPREPAKRAAGGHAWAQRKSKEETERAESAAVEDGDGEVVAAKKDPKKKDDVRIELPGGYTAPAPLRKGAVGLGERRKAEQAEAEREAVVKARAEEARESLAARRKAAMRSMMDSSDDDATTDDDEDRRAKGVSRADQEALLAIGQGGFDFAAAAAAVLPDGGSFRTLGAEAKGNGKKRRGKGGGGGRGDKKGERKRAPGLIEMVKPGKKSKAFPRSGEKSATFR